jgi:hypothetical protein
MLQALGNVLHAGELQQRMIHEADERMPGGEFANSDLDAEGEPDQGEGRRA